MHLIPAGLRLQIFVSHQKLLSKCLAFNGNYCNALKSIFLQSAFFSNQPVLQNSAPTHVGDMFSRGTTKGKILAAAHRLIQCGQTTRHSNQSLSVIKEYVKEAETILGTINDLGVLMKEASGDEEMEKLSVAELKEMEALLHDTEQKILNHLIPHDEMDDNSVLLEITAGVGGQEAMLFADDIFNMYLNFIQNHNWNIVSCVTDKNSSAGGLRHGSITISGNQVYRFLKYEGGIHRVQRIPVTERSGRVHTSTAAVAVLPQPTEIQVSIGENEIKIETKRASGAGGQHVNTTDSAVRITHFPTGIVVENQTERSQIRNKELAFKRLRALIYEQQCEKQLTQQRLKRKLQVGTSARSEKIRTYNFNQDRVTDHRIGLTVRNLSDFMKGGQTLQFMVESLQMFAYQENLQILLETYS